LELEISVDIDGVPFENRKVQVINGLSSSRTFNFCSMQLAILHGDPIYNLS
jgi:hypothetical protein